MKAMIAYLEGKIILKKDKFVILENAGVGYKVFLSQKTMANLPNQDILRAFCFHNVKEDASDLYGFLTYGEQEFFEMLMDIRGVGPKAALEISSLGSLEKIKDRILKQDEGIFAGIPGIGAKKAMTIILELTGRIKLLNTVKHRPSADEAENALVQLGFSHQQAKDALGSVPSTIKATEERVKEALKSLGKN